jgi:mannose-6-phosphate isomerase-like protein (cupin superfamily)
MRGSYAASVARPALADGLWQQAAARARADAASRRVARPGHPSAAAAPESVSGTQLITSQPRIEARAAVARSRARRYRQRMPRLVPEPFLVPAAGTPPKIIAEHFGRVASGTDSVSVAHMTSPPGWTEPGQTPEFDEYTVVLRGALRVESRGGVLEVRAGQAVHVARGEWVRYSSPGPDGAEYFAICVPAFSPGAVHRDG